VADRQQDDEPPQVCADLQSLVKKTTHYYSQLTCRLYIQVPQMSCVYGKACGEFVPSEFDFSLPINNRISMS